ncbi:conserved hypothetical protein [Vibrio jasicida]|uniref:Uncharacterized protein n=1 Tax=Vibrio jasicida TaxID=766224 RepID=A0AAU9QQR4_9VIBR|nr:conserved hypothetical protein [Vibrio jasicida]CAH1599084.1 conserved hypothetical protein [Vibrio jasicida]
MSRTMLLGVLRLPIDCWDNGPVDQMQRHERYVEAADLIEDLDSKVEQLESQLEVQNALLTSGKTVPNLLTELTKMCLEDGIESDEDFLDLFGSVNWHDIDVDDGPGMVKELRWVIERRNTR